MDEYPTAEEEYELMYGEELEMMDDFDESEKVAAKPIVSTQKPSTSNQMSVVSSPALSQISRNGMMNFTPDHGPSKKTSTPFMDKLRAFQSKDSGETCDLENNGALQEIQNIGVKRKRRLEDLFGDIYDIADEDDNFFKKPKTEEERDLDTIEQILAARRTFQTQVNPLKKTNYDRLEALHQFKKINLSRVVPKFPFLTVSKADERIYVRNHSEEFENMKLSEIKAFRTTNNLLGLKKEEIWKEANDLVLKGANIVSQAPQVAILPNPANESVDLWVEKYRPRKYIDLLSDESTNRSLLQWLKLWDKIVFKREVVKKNVKPGELSNFNKKTGRFEQNGGWKKRQKGSLNTELDSNNVPIQKVALLVGKPGLGKTTLAHTIAKHAGYEIREMNASDDRTVDSFRQALENGTQMTSVLNRDSRPNCIILDEIDGAPIASIEFLIRFVSGQVTEKSKKGINNKKFILKRPIICICNDLYGANLRSLRQIAFIVNFQQMDNSRLAERLLHIANKERVRSDLTSLLALAEKTNGDIRSCLSMIQFFSCSKKQLTLLDVMRSSIGQKDQHKNLFSVWNSIFQIQRPKKTIKIGEEQKQVIAMSDMSTTTRMEYILSCVKSGGDYDRLILGVFENFLKQKLHDPNMEEIVEANRWFCFDDRVQNKINSLQNYSIYPYLVFGFVSWHFSFGTMAFPQISLPLKQHELSQKSSTTNVVFNNLKKGMAPTLRGIGSGFEMLMDSISLLKVIICPEIRSVSLHLLSEKEKLEVKHTVDVIADLGLTFNQLQSAEGTYIYRVEPDIEYLSGNFNESQGPQMSYWSKQLIAREVELEKMRRAKPKVSGELKENKERPKAKDVKEISDSKSLPNHLQRLVPKAIKAAKPSVVISKDFFGRISTKSSVTSSQNEENLSDVLVKSPIWFKFKAGYSNAVRTEVTLADLL